jgi:autotransporter-associated beta strand protein
MMTDTNGVTTAQYTSAAAINPAFVAVAQQVQPMVHIGAYHLGDLPPGLSGVNATNGSLPLRLPANSPFTLSPTIANSTYITSAPVRGAVLGLYGTNNQVADATCVLVVNENYGTNLSTTVLGPGNLSVFNPATGMWTAQGQSSAAVTVLPGGCALVGLTASLPAQEGTQYATNTLAWGTDLKWASSSGGLYTMPWTNGNNAVFAGSGTASIAASGVTAENLFFTNVTGCLIQNSTLTLNGYTPTITVGSGLSATISSAINGSVGIIKAGRGTLTLSGANTYGGGTTVNGGTLQITSDSQLGAGPGSPTVNLALNGGQLFNNGGALSLNANRNISLGSLGGYIQSSWASAITVPGQISGYGGLGVPWGNGSVVLSGANSYTGATTIGTTGNAYSNNASANPTLQLGNANALPQTDLIFGASANNNIATLDMNGYNATVSALAGGANAVVDIVSAGGTSTLTVGATNINSTFSGVSTFGGVIRNTTGTVALNKIGSGTNTLSGANTYGGGTIVTTGTLVAQGDGALGSGNVTVSAGSTLQLGGGTVNSYINAYASLLIQSGANPVNLAFTGSPDLIAGLSFNGGATFQATGTWGSTSSGAANQDNTHFSGTGKLLVVAAVTQPVITAVSLTAGGGGLVFSGTNGTPTVGFFVLSTTNLALPLADWIKVTNGTYGSLGSFTVTNPVNPAIPQFYILSTP